jgi:uncharacterized repeat protein (TIGR03803 family)
MTILTFSRGGLCSCVAAALLTNCAAPPIGEPNVIPQSNEVAPIRPATHRITSGSYEELYRFPRQWRGIHPAAGLVYVNGSLYGTTTSGGASANGTVYSVSPSGQQKVIYRFRGGADGSFPQSGLLNVNGTLYGTTTNGGASGDGTVYSISTSGSEKVLYAFKGGSDGESPFGGLIAVNGTLYGTTQRGGSSECNESDGCGTVFSVTTSGQETILHRFTTGTTGVDGALPDAGLLDVKGVLYGTTALGGSCQPYGPQRSCGTVFSITTAGVEKVLYEFQGGSDGNDPEAPLIEANGLLYGTTYNGGIVASDCGDYGCGTVFSITTQGTEKVLYRFADGSDGAQPLAGLVEVNGTLYGTTSEGGGVGACFAPDGNCGTVFSVTPAGTESVLYRFTGGTDGWEPIAPLTNVNSTLYGTTYYGGKDDSCCARYGNGTVFSLTL